MAQQKTRLQSALLGKSPTMFRYFGKLPAELRHKIWRTSMEPRVLQLAYDIEKGISNKTAVTAAFQACSKARVVLSKEFQLLFSYVTQNQSKKSSGRQLRVSRSYHLQVWNMLSVWTFRARIAWNRCWDQELRFGKFAKSSFWSSGLGELRCQSSLLDNRPDGWGCSYNGTVQWTSSLLW